VRRVGLTGMVVAVLVAAVHAVPAAADPIAGASYQGAAADGAMVELTVSSDGTLVDFYLISGQASGACIFAAEGQSGVWEGAPIHNNAFEYRLRDQILFQGTFHAGQSVSGTFRLHISGAAGQSCDTGIVSWTATTSAKPPPGSGGPGGVGGGGGNAHKFVTRITLRKASTKMLRGQIKSPNRACLAGREVILWQGKHRIRTVRSNARGKFSFARTASVRGRAIRASTPARSVQAGACAAGSSTFIKG
jgi:hypothetical protein